MSLFWSATIELSTAGSWLANAGSRGLSGADGVPTVEPDGIGGDGVAFTRLNVGADEDEGVTLGNGYAEPEEGGGDPTGLSIKE